MSDNTGAERREPTWEDSALRIAAGLCGETGHRNFEAYVVRIADALDALRLAVSGCHAVYNHAWGFMCGPGGLCPDCQAKRDVAIAQLLDSAAQTRTDGEKGDTLEI